jgi:anti-sigma regulatory factor (Ser/Thr protein kinase)
VKDSFSLAFSSDIKTVRHVVNAALDNLTGVYPAISGELYLDFKVLLSELLLNAVTHGNCNDKRKKVSLLINIADDDTVSITITDEGSGYDSRKIIKNLSNTISFSEHGRGMRLVYSLADKVEHSSPGNLIRIYKKAVEMQDA